jgi:GNAT superfamily N-acetyltransferase
MDPELRIATAEDAATILRMMRDYYAFDHLPFDEHAAESALEPLLADARLGEVWLAERDGAPLGYGVLCFGWSLEFHGRDAFVDEIFLVPESRGTGLGRRLLEHLENRARERGVGTIHLEVERENHRAHGVYRAGGYVDHDRFLLSKRLRSS